MSRPARAWFSAMVPLLLVAASCQWMPLPQPPVPTTKPAPKPSPEAQEQERKLAALLARIEEMERRAAATSRPAAPVVSPPVEPSPVRPTSPAPTVTDSADVRAGMGGRVALLPDEVSVRMSTPLQTTDTPREVTLADLISALEARARTEKTDLDLQRRLRVLYLLDGREDQALEPIAGASAEEQALWRQTLWALITYSNAKRIPSDAERAGAAWRALDDAVRGLARQAPLAIQGLTFCREVRGFGDVAPVPAEFKPGQPALLYLELDGFAVEEAADKKSHRIRLKQRLELLTLRGDSVWTNEFPDVENTCARPRRDLHFYSRFTVPERLLPGQYVLKVTMTDLLAKKTTEQTITLAVP